MHTLLSFTLAQYLVIRQCFPSAGSEPPQTGRTFSVGLAIKSALHLEHLTLWSLTRLMVMGYEEYRTGMNLLVHPIFQFNTRFEIRESLFLNLNGFAGFGISPLVWLILFYLETAKSANLNSVSLS